MPRLAAARARKLKPSRSHSSARMMTSLPSPKQRLECTTHSTGPQDLGLRIRPGEEARQLLSGGGTVNTTPDRRPSFSWGQVRYFGRRGPLCLCPVVAPLIPPLCRTLLFQLGCPVRSLEARGLDCGGAASAGCDVRLFVGTGFEASWAGSLSVALLGGSVAR